VNYSSNVQKAVRPQSCDAWWKLEKRDPAVGIFCTGFLNYGLKVAAARDFLSRGMHAARREEVWAFPRLTIKKMLNQPGSGYLGPFR